MSALSIVVGILVLTVCFGLMIWGRKYLGEEAGRNPKGIDGKKSEETIAHPCSRCGSCGMGKDS